MSTHNFELPRRIDHYLAILSKTYGKNEGYRFQALLVNAQTKVHEGWDYDNWNGGTYGHALYLTLPEQLYLDVVDQKSIVEETIREDFNKIHNVQNEYIAAVFIEMESSASDDWRKESGLLITGKKIVSSDTAEDIWGDDGFRVFLSHKTEVKRETTELKMRLQKFNISSFVAHTDIHPTKAWQDEIESALASMNGFVALMTEDFHNSDWTDQEVGYAFARGIPIIAVRLGKDPYGFIGKFQGLTTTWDRAPYEIVKLFMKQDRMIDSFVESVRNCSSFSHGNTLAKLLPEINHLSEEQVDKLIEAFNSNEQLKGSYGFIGSYSYGLGIAHYLNIHSRREFNLSKNNEIVQKN
jgi:hypothetical protein